MNNRVEKPSKPDAVVQLPNSIVSFSSGVVREAKLFRHGTVCEGLGVQRSWE